MQSRTPTLIGAVKDYLVEFSGGKLSDSIKKNDFIKTKIISSIQLALDPRKTKGIQLKHTYTFQDSIIKYQSQNSLELSNNKVTVINRKDGEQTYYILKDSSLVRDASIAFSYRPKENYEALDVKEYREHKKTIHGYDCFKVVLEFESNYMNTLVDPLEIFPRSESLLSKYGDSLRYKTIYEIFVTDKIKCKYHPTFNIPEVLEKYYPLEVIKKNSSIEGNAIRYLVKELEITPTEK